MKIRVNLFERDFEMLHSLQKTSFEVGGSIFADEDGIRRISFFPGRRENDDSVNPDDFPRRKPIIFHTHRGDPGEYFQKVMGSFSESGRVDVNAIVLPPSPADIFTTGEFFIRNRTALKIICAPEGVYFLRRKRAVRKHEVDRFRELFKVLSQLVDETVEATLDRQVPLIRRDFTEENISEFQKTIAQTVCRTINNYSRIIEARCVLWSELNSGTADVALYTAEISFGGGARA